MDYFKQIIGNGGQDLKDVNQKITGYVCHWADPDTLDPYSTRKLTGQRQRKRVLLIVSPRILVPPLPQRALTAAT